MRSYERSTTGLTLAAAGIAALQAPSAGVPLTLTLTDLIPARRVTLTSAADLSAIAFTIVGTDRSGAPISETVTGPNIATVTGNKVFASIASITPNGTNASSVSVGYGTEVISGWMPIGHLWHNLSYSVDVVGTVNYDIERTNRNILREGINGDQEAAASDVVTGQTGASLGVIEGGVGALRIVQNSGSGTVTLRVIPAQGK